MLNKLGLRSIVAGVSCAALMVGIDRPADAAPEPDCFAALKQRAVVAAFDAQFELARARDPMIAFASYNAALLKWRRTIHSTPAHRCLLAHTHLLVRYSKFVRRIGRDVRAIRAKRDAFCKQFGSFVIARFKRQIRSSQDRGENRTTKHHAAAFKRALAKRPIFRKCPPLKKQIARLVSQYLPNLSVRVRIPKQVAQLRTHERWSHTRIAEVERGLAQRPAQIVPTPLVDNKGERALAGHLAQCQRAAANLRKLGVDGSASVFDGRTLNDVNRDCAARTAGLSALLLKARRHNKVTSKAIRKRWERVSLYGWAMWKAYRRYGKPDVEKRGQRGTSWTFLGRAATSQRCLTLRFSRSGRLRGRLVGGPACHKRVSRRPSP